MQQARILVVDDEMSFRLFLKALFETNGHVPVLARNGIEGLRLAREQAPDLIVLDVMMPQSGGVDMYCNLAKDPVLADVPVIMLSAVPGMTFEHVLDMLGAAGTDVKKPFAYVEKPPRPEIMLSLAQAALDRETRTGRGGQEVAHGL